MITVRGGLILFGSELGTLAGRSPLGNERTTSLLLFSSSLCNKLAVCSSFFLVSEDGLDLGSLSRTFTLKLDRSHKTLNFRCLANGHSLLVGEGSGDDVLTDIVFLGEVEEFTDVVGTLRTKTTWDGIVSESSYFFVSNLGDNQVEDGNVLCDDASTDRLTFALSAYTRSVALIS